MFERLTNLTSISSVYKPLEELERVHAVINRELDLPSRLREVEQLPLYGAEWVGLASALHVMAIIGLSWWLCVRDTTSNPLPSLLVLIIPNLVISMGADVYAGMRIISLWHSHSQHTMWDSVRLTMPSDHHLLKTYEALGNIRTWRALQIDMSMRSLPAVLLAMIGGMLLMAVLVFGVIMQISRWREFIWMAVLGVLCIRLATLYVRDPLWRFRTNTMWSLLCAAQFQDTVTALITCIGGSLGLRMLHWGVLIGLASITRSLQGPVSVIEMPLHFWEALAWAAVLLVVVAPVTQGIYQGLYALLGRWTVITLRRGT